MFGSMPVIGVKCLVSCFGLEDSTCRGFVRALSHFPHAGADPGVGRRTDHTSFLSLVTPCSSGECEPRPESLKERVSIPFSDQMQGGRSQPSFPHGGTGDLTQWGELSDLNGHVAAECGKRSPQGHSETLAGCHCFPSWPFTLHLGPTSRKGSI